MTMVDPAYEQILIAKLKLAEREYLAGRMTEAELREIIDDVERKTKTN